MDVTRFLDLAIAPKVLFDTLEERRDRVRFWVPRPGAGTDLSAYTAVTYGAFAADVRALACALAAELEPGDRAAIFAPNRVEWATAALAVQAVGGAVVPVYPASTPAQLAYVLDHSDARVLFVDTPALLAKVLEAWPGLHGGDRGERGLQRVVLLDADLDAARVLAKLRADGRPAPGDEALARVVSLPTLLAEGAARDAASPGAFEARMAAVSLDQPGMMLYTSGTSGNPKGVPLTHRNVGTNGKDWLTLNGPLVPEDAVDVLWLPMSHIFGFGEMNLGNTLGMTSYLSDPVGCIALVPVVKPHVFMSVPSHWEKLAAPALRETDVAAQQAALRACTGGRLAFCLSGGAGLKREIKELYHSAGILIVEGYGLTETSPTLTLNRADSFRFDSVGKPLPSVELKLAEDGEILAKGPNVFGGYHKDEAATRAAFTADGWFQTGDVGRFTEDGFLQIIDRKKDILVTAGGKNIPPANIEQHFQGDPRFAHVVVYGDGKKYLVCGVWLNGAVVDAELAHLPASERAAAREALVAARVAEVNAHLPSYETLKAFHIFDEPLTVERELLTASLKVRRKKVVEAFRAELEALYDRPAPERR
ncbi:MAG TPA: AMP-binding protein [Polyangiaceae bacterium]|nr:AMP-binding protein [Polyangiaceae bacterium]